MTRNTVFDLASITKPVVTALSIVKLYEEKKVRLDDRIDKFLAGFKGRAQGGKTIEQILTHTAGFPAWFPVYSLPPGERTAYLAERDTGAKKPVYSCLGYIVLGKIVEEITRTGLDDYFSVLIKKLNLQSTCFGPDRRRSDFAATEDRDRYERSKCRTIGARNAREWRDYVICAEVHDGNCHYGYRGVAGNAGLFSSASELASLMRAYVRAELVSRRAVEMMTRNHTGGRRGRGLGWVVDIYPGSLSPRSFGHTGFTGTMVCFDPARELLTVLLTNDIHPRVRPGNMPPIRRRLMKLLSGAFA